MTTLAKFALFLLLAAVVLTVVRLLRGPTVGDRLAAAQALAVIAIPGLAWLALILESPVYIDVALVCGVLGWVAVMAVARSLEGRRP